MYWATASALPEFSPTQSRPQLRIERLRTCFAPDTTSGRPDTHPGRRRQTQPAFSLKTARALLRTSSHVTILALPARTSSSRRAISSCHAASTSASAASSRLSIREVARSALSSAGKARASLSNAAALSLIQISPLPCVIIAQQPSAGHNFACFSGTARFLPDSR